MTDDGRYLVIRVSHGTDRRERIYYQDLGGGDAPRLDGEVVPLLDDFDASYNFIGNVGSDFHFVTDLDAPRQRLIAIDVEAPERENWREILAERDGSSHGIWSMPTAASGSSGWMAPTSVTSSSRLWERWGA